MGRVTTPSFSLLPTISSKRARAGADNLRELATILTVTYFYVSLDLLHWGFRVKIFRGIVYFFDYFYVVFWSTTTMYNQE